MPTWVTMPRAIRSMMKRERPLLMTCAPISTMTGAPIAPRLEDPLGDDRQRGMLERLAGRVDRQHVGQRHVVDAFGEGFELQSGTVELGVGHGFLRVA